MSTESEEDNTKMEQFLRDWRQDALNKAQYDSAIFIGDKLLALTSLFLFSSISVRSGSEIVLTIPAFYRRRLRRFLAGASPFRRRQLHQSTEIP